MRRLPKKLIEIAIDNQGVPVVPVAKESVNEEHLLKKYDNDVALIDTRGRSETCPFLPSFS